MAKTAIKKIISALNLLLFPLARLYSLIFKPGRVGVKIIIRHKDKILLLKRSYGAGSWTLPGGGIGKNESPKESAKREAKEEAGINLENISQFGSFRHEGKNIKDLVYVFVTEVQDKNIDINNYEIREAQWFHINDLRNKLPEWQPILKKCLEQAKLL